MTGRAWGWSTGAALLLLGALWVGLHMGPVPIDVGQAWLDGWRGMDSAEAVILLEIRLPRVLLALLVGAALGLSGAALQGFLRNPLADPGVMGVSGCAALGAVLALYFGWAALHPALLPLAGLLGAGLSVLLILGLAGRDSSIMTLLLAGLAVNLFATTLIALALNFAASPYAMSEMVFWLLGSVANRSLLDVWQVLPFLLLGGALIFLAWRYLEALSLGESTARTLGFADRRWRWLLIVGVALCVGAAVAVSGMIGFVGLMVPHLVRPLVRYRPGPTLGASAVAGAILLLLADWLVQSLPGQTELKLGIVTSLLGAPFFFALVLVERRRSV